MGRKELMKRLLEARADKDRFSVWGGDELLQKFLKLKDRLPVPQNDMTYWTSGKNPHKPEELSLILKELEQNAVKKSEEQKLIEKGAEKVFEDSNWLVYHITNFEACQKYGKNTKWCITGTDFTGNPNAYGRTHWDNYTREGNDFFFFIEKGSDVKYAVMINEDGEHKIFNPKDKEIPYIKNAPTVPGLPDVSENNPVYDGDDEDEENEDEENQEPAAPPPFNLEPVQNPNAMEFTASTLEDALNRFSGVYGETALKVGDLRQDLFSISLGNGKFTIFVFNGRVGGPLMTQRGPGQFALVTFDNLEVLTTWFQANMANVQVQDQAAADQPQPANEAVEEKTKKSDFNTPEELVLALLDSRSNEVWYWGTQQPGQKHGAFGKGLSTLEAYYNKVSKEPNTTIDKKVVKDLLDELKRTGEGNWTWWNYTKDDGKGNQSYFTSGKTKLVQFSLRSYLSAYEEAISKGVTLNDVKQKKVTFLFPLLKTKWEGPFSGIDITGKKQPQNPEIDGNNSAKLDKEEEKGDNTMEKEVKPMEEAKKVKKSVFKPTMELIDDLVDTLLNQDYDNVALAELLQDHGMFDYEVKERYDIPFEDEFAESKKPEEKFECEDGVMRTQKEYEQWIKHLKQLYISSPNDLTDEETDALIDAGVDLDELDKIAFGMNEAKKSEEKFEKAEKTFVDLMKQVEADDETPDSEIVSATTSLLRSLVSSKKMSQEEYDHVTKNWDEILKRHGMMEAKKPVMEAKKSIKEGIRLVDSPKQKTVKEEVKLSFDGEPLPVDVKDLNTHHKLRLFKHK